VSEARKSWVDLAPAKTQRAFYYLAHGKGTLWNKARTGSSGS